MFASPPIEIGGLKMIDARGLYLKIAKRKMKFL